MLPISVRSLCCFRLARLPALLTGVCLMTAAALTGQTPTAAAASPATLEIQIDKPLHAVSPRLYGLMTEEINYSYDGGLYAELVRNRDFGDHDWSGVPHWNVVETGTGRATMTLNLPRVPGRDESSQTPLKKEAPVPELSADQPQSLRLTVKEVDAANPAGIRNEGYWGMAVRPKSVYRGSFFARAEDSGSAQPVRMALLSDETGAVLAEGLSEAITGEWKRYEVSLKTGATIAASKNNHLELTLAKPGTVDLQMVSLFPPTYHDRPNGFRPDLMELMAGMHPKFLRLPGGNYLEGDTIDERFDWKATLGPLENRSTHRSPWNYRSTDGMGLLEFLEWTEDLKIEPLLAVYAGYSLKGAHVAPGAALQPYVDDAVDEVEFATGDAGTKWGGVRAKLGHPKPFPLHYVEIGNEDWFDKSGSYEGRYTQFYRALKAKYPGLEYIATAPVTRMQPDVIDDHYYKRADEFYAMVNHYDDAKRDGSKVFVGEWATREGSPTTNVGAMLGDAAWMTGMERNSDLIVMASYAPLLVNVNPGGMQWESDLIGYDAMSAYGSPSYYAQALFAQYLGTEVPSSTKTGGSERFFYSATTDAAKGRLYLKLVNATTVPQAVQVRLNGAAKLAREASVESLSGKSTSETNSITDLRRVVPVASTLRGVSPSFAHTVPPLTIEVMEIGTK